MEITELGMVIDVSELQSLKADSPMEETELGMVLLLQPCMRVFVAVSIMALQPLRLSYTVLPFSTTIDVNSLHPAKALKLIAMIELGIVTDVMLVLLKAA